MEVGNVSSKFEAFYFLYTFDNRFLFFSSIHYGIFSSPAHTTSTPSRLATSNEEFRYDVTAQILGVEIGKIVESKARGNDFLFFIG